MTITRNLTPEAVVEAAMTVPSMRRSIYQVSKLLGITKDELKAFLMSLGPDSPVGLQKNPNFIKTGTPRGGGSTRKADPKPNKPKPIAQLIANDPGGTTKEDLYRQCLLTVVEQDNWAMNRAMKRGRMFG